MITIKTINTLDNKKYDFYKLYDILDMFRNYEIKEWDKNE